MQRGCVDISVVVPCYNTQRFLDQALTSVEQNASCNLEILAIDDGSTDDSLRIMEKHAARDPRVRVVSKANEGYGATVNRGIDEARGTYVAILEPDDWVLPHAYDHMFGLAASHGMPDVAKAAYWRVIGQDGADGMMAYGYLHGRVRRLREAITLADEPQLIQYHPSVWSALYSRDFLDREAIRMKEVPGAGWVDNPFCVQTLAAAKSIVYTDDAFYCYREDLATASSATVSARLMIDRWNDRQDVLEKLGVEDAGILRANVIVGLRFFSGILHTNALDDPALLLDAQGMARRMGANTIRTVDCVSPQIVSEVLRLAGSDAPAPSMVRYAAHLARETAWALHNNGMRFFVHNLALVHNS